MSLVTLPHTLAPGDPEDVSHLMADLAALRDAANNLDAANIAAGAVGTTHLTANAATASKFHDDVVNVAVPYTIDINPFLTAATQTSWTSVDVKASAMTGALKHTTGVQNAEIGWDVNLTAGAWTFTLLHETSDDVGIYTVSLDGTSVGTIDGYSAGTTANVVSTITDVAVPVTAKKRVLLKMATKNGSSSSYVGQIQALGFRRAA